jgi:hypothetical protein
MKIKITIAFLILLLILFSAGNIHAFYDTSIGATVKLGVCGNNIVEYLENCEGSDLNRKTCQNMGFSGGTLKCDIACAYDTSGCLNLLVTPTPTSTSSSVSTSAPTTETLESYFLPPNSSAVTILKTILNIENLPLLLVNLDPNKNGRIEADELAIVAGTWVKSWSSFLKDGSGANNCDINSDNICDLSDFSIVLYHIGR